jgi:hypothetical protein
MEGFGGRRGESCTASTLAPSFPAQAMSATINNQAIPTGIITPCPSIRLQADQPVIGENLTINDGTCCTSFKRSQVARQQDSGTLRLEREAQ